MIDSLQLKDGQTLYWFYNADMLGGKSVSYFAIGNSLCETYDSNAIIKGDLMYEINHVNRDTIYVTTFIGFETLKKHPVFSFQNVDAQPGQSFKRHELAQEKPFSELCK